jgi:hypothetical protein
MAAALQVPDPYPTIQSAINATVSFDEVIVQPGIYYEYINFRRQKITVRSVNPDDPNCVADTIINGSLPVEMGVDEVFTHSMDFDVSGSDDQWALSLFLEQWLTGDDGMDFNNDEIVDLVDCASFALAWLWTAHWYTD